MLASVEGVYRDGRIELTEIPTSISEDTPVIVTFLTSGLVDLREHGIDESLAAELRAGFATFAEDWDAPEMDIYDRYETYVDEV
ncbi:MAG: hypothetical protein F4Y84_13670 [Caldilineaceae bacterium SB0665_bin_25]|nr:hypothetical protein [Caldilineaceae bacterium SB0665_bin_25]